jgi:hypothetical protein
LATYPFTTANLPYDQRGSAFLRVRDGDLVGKPGAKVDIGAIDTSKLVRAAGVTIGSSDASVVHPDYQVPDHVHTNPFSNATASQVTSIPVTRPDEATIRFSNSVLVSSISYLSFSIRALQTANTYTITNIVPILLPGSTTLASGVKWTFSSSAGVNFSDQIEIKVKQTVLDADSEPLDGKWDNPAMFNDPSGRRFPSGDGVSTGSDFLFKVTVLRADYNHDNVVDGSDFGIWNSHNFTYPKTRNTYYNGDVTADGAVDGSDFGIWNSMKFTVNWQSTGLRGLDTEWMRQQIDFLILVYGVLENDGVTVNANATRETWEAFASAVEAVFAGIGYEEVDDDGITRDDSEGDAVASLELWDLCML